MSGSISDRVRIDFGSFSDRLGLSQPSCHPRPTLETAVTPGIDARYCFTTETYTHGHLPYACLFIMPVNHRSGWFKYCLIKKPSDLAHSDAIAVDISLADTRPRDLARLANPNAKTKQILADASLRCRGNERDGSANRTAPGPSDNGTISKSAPRALSGVLHVVLAPAARRV